MEFGSGESEVNSTYKTRVVMYVIALFSLLGVFLIKALRGKGAYMIIMSYLMGVVIGAFCVAAGMAAGSEGFLTVGSLLAAASTIFLFD